MKRDLILGCIHGYRWPQISPFVHSLRDTGYAGDIGFFTGGLDVASRAALAGQGVSLLEFARTVPTKHVTWRTRLWKSFRWLPYSLRRELYKRLCGLTSLRHFYYLDFLRKHGADYRQIFILDVRDVVFQTNPFAGGAGQGVHLFEDSRRITNGSEPVTAAWLKNLFGEDALREVGHFPIICAGSILGDPASLERFIEKLIRHLTTERAIQNMGDQVCLNVMIRQHNDLNFQIHTNGDTVLTMANMRDEDFRLNGTGQLVNATGEVIPVLHQFDRHPAMSTTLAVLKNGCLTRRNSGSI